MARKTRVVPIDAPADHPAAPIIEDVAAATAMPEPDTSFNPAELERPPAPEPKRQYQPDPHPYAQITLGDGNNAPKIRLWRNNRKGEVAVTFDEKPAAQHIETLRDAGFRWQAVEKA